MIALRSLRRAVALGLLAGVLAAGAAMADDAPAPPHEGKLVTIPTRAGVTQDFLLVQPAAGPPAAAVVLFAGGDGDLHLADRGPGTKSTNFLVRSRYLFADAGFLVAVPDTPSDHRSGYGKSFRGSEEHAADIAALIAYLRTQAGVPVWLIGTSMGTLSAAKGALLSADGPDGLVLTSSITRHTRQTILTVPDLSLAKIRIPTLVVAHREDACGSTPASGAQEIATRLTAARKVEVKLFDGGSTPEGDPCEPISRHGYIGIEPEVVAAIAAWIKASAPH
jgi:pimeloyl-ACP methyl ester carboxylesterase